MLVNFLLDIILVEDEVEFLMVFKVNLVIKLILIVVVVGIF